MEAPVLDVVLDNRRLGEAQLAPLIEAWRSGQYVVFPPRICAFYKSLVCFYLTDQI